MVGNILKIRIMSGVSAIAISAALGAVVFMPDEAAAICTGAETAGNDTITCTGPATRGDIDSTFGDDVITLDGSAGQVHITGHVRTGADQDTVSVTGDVLIDDVVVTGVGGDTVTFNGGQVNGAEIGTRGGNDTVTFNDGQVAGVIDTGEGDDTLTFNGGQVNGTRTILGHQYSILTGADPDNVTFNGGQIVGGINLGGGADELVVGGGIIGSTIAMDGGHDIITINGGTLSGGIGVRGEESGNDTIVINGGTVGLNQDGNAIFTGGDADQVGLFGGSVAGPIALAGGADLLVIDAGADEFNGAITQVFVPGMGDLTHTPAGGSLTATPTFFNGGNGEDVAEIFDLVTTTDLEFRSFNDVNFYGQSITLQDGDGAVDGGSDQTVSNLRLWTDANGNGSVLTQTSGALYLRGEDGGQNGANLIVDGNSTVSLQDGAADDQIRVGTYTPGANSTLAVDIDQTATGYDENGSDFVRVQNADPTGPVNIDVALQGSASLSGSRRIVDDIDSAALDNDPGVNATPTPSADYVLVNDPSTAGRIYWLEKEGDTNGVFLRWTTPINGITGGAYLGGGSEDKNNIVDPDGPGAGAALIASASGVSNVATHIGDLNIDGAKTLCSDGHDPINGWLTGSVSQGNVGKNSNENWDVAAGIERRMNTSQSDVDCAQTAFGVFAFYNEGNTEYKFGGKTEFSGYGAGAYLRHLNSEGFYATLQGHVGFQEVDIDNAVVGSTADTDRTNWGIHANLGKLTAIDTKNSVDARLYGSYFSSDEEAFKDSLGLKVSGASGTMTVLGAHIGLHHELSENQAAFGRVGVKWTDIDTAVKIAGIGLDSERSYTSGTFEVGIRNDNAFDNSSQLSLSMFGEYGGNIDSIGGRFQISRQF